MIDSTSGFHQVRVDMEASKLLIILTNMECFSFTVMPQGVCNSSALWNILTDSNSHIDSDLNIIKNMDDSMLYGKDEADLETKWERVMILWRRI